MTPWQLYSLSMQFSNLSVCIHGVYTLRFLTNELQVVTYSFMPLALLLAVICGLFTHLFFLTMHHDSW